MNKKPDGKKQKSPKAALYERGNVQPLVKDEKAKHHYRPLTQEEKDAAYPELDTCTRGKAAKTLSLADEEIIALDESVTEKKRDAKLKKARKKQGKGRKDNLWIQAFLTFPLHMAVPKSGFAVMFAAMLAQFSGFLPRTTRTIRSIYFEDDAAANAICVILKSINGPDLRKGKRYTLRRPLYLAAERDAPSSAGYSTSEYAYFGGKLNIWWRQHSFWLPLWNCAVAIADDFPTNLKKIVAEWKTVFPIYCGGNPSTSNESLRLSSSDLEIADSALLETAENAALLVNTLFRSFADYLRKHHKFAKKLAEKIKRYLPERHINGVGTIKPEAKEKFFSAGLCVYGAFLDLLAKYGWISTEEGYEFYNAAQESVFPKALVRGISLTTLLTGSWNDQELFFAFLSKHLGAHLDGIKSDGTPCETDTIAALHKMGGRELLALPYSLTLSAYRNFLNTFGAATNWGSEAEFYCAAKKWGIDGFKTGSRPNDPWRHAFFRAERAKNKPINCLGIPVSELPEDVRKVIEQAKPGADLDGKAVN